MTETVWDGSGSMEGLTRRTVLPSGLRIVTEAVPGVRSVAFGAWVGVGSRDESRPEAAGASHFLEHLLFKGTARHSALDISAGMDEIGGEANAFTSKEYTCYYARVLGEDLPVAADIICDLVTGSLLRQEDIDAERGVILEEIAQRDDDPGDAVHDVFAEAALADSPLGRPILGTVGSIESMSRDVVADHYGRYRLPKVVVTAAGRLDHDSVARQVESSLAPVLAAAPDAAPAGLRVGVSALGSSANLRGADSPGASPGATLPGAAVPGGTAQGATLPSVTSGATLPGATPLPLAPERLALLARDTEQANVVLGCAGLARRDERRFALGVLTAALGGGMSSRLFQEIREKRGLAYSVYSFSAQFADTGLFGAYAGCAPGRVEEVLDLTRGILDGVRRDGVTAEELARGKGQITRGLALELEDTPSRMSRLGKSELSYGEYLDLDTLVARVAAVTQDSVAELAEDLLSRPRALAVIGPFDERDFLGAVA